MTWHSWSLHHLAEISYCKYLRKFRTLACKSGDTSSWQDYAIYIMYKKEHKPFGGLLKKNIYILLLHTSISNDGKGNCNGNGNGICLCNWYKYYSSFLKFFIGIAVLSLGDKRESHAPPPFGHKIFPFGKLVICSI